MRTFHLLCALPALSLLLCAKPLRSETYQLLPWDSTRPRKRIR